MSLTLVTGPLQEPVSLAEAKLHCRIDHDDEDAYVLGLIRAAREMIETWTHRAMVTQTWDQKGDAFPCGAIVLPIAPVSAVTSITYLDTAGAMQTWSALNYLTDLPSGPKAQKARVTPGHGVSYPITYGVMNAVTVRFVAGYGAVGALVPMGLRQAIVLLVAHWYQNREAVVVSVGGTATPLPSGVEALIWPYVVH
jgi:uncharacterized phiE125 gp8 family phage protein